jgi:hypothetical protein
MWLWNKKLRNKIRTTEMRLHVRRENRTRNEAVCEETDVSSSPVRNMGNRALRYCGHVERMRGGRVPKHEFYWSLQGGR